VTVRRWRSRRRPRAARPDVEALVAQHLAAGAPTGWFEPLYAAAAVLGDTGVLPWGVGPHPYLVDWLRRPPLPVPSGGRAVVVGAGLGDDAVAVAEALPDVEVTAFDVAPSAVGWARSRHPRSAVTWEVADLLALPDAWLGRFDLVVEVRTVPSLPGVVREAAMHAIGTLAAPGGVVVAIGLLATSSDAARRVEGPPWPQAPAELAAYRAAGLARVALEHPPAAGASAVEARSTWVRGPAVGAASGLPLA
jgi:SAM-dependent methyltransferase